MPSHLKSEIIRIGKLLWDKGLVFGFNGNLSMRNTASEILITATGTCLGFLSEEDIITINHQGDVIGEGKASSERLLHTAIYQRFPKIKAVLHTHTTYTNGFFLNNDRFFPKTFEAQFYLGEVKALAQSTPSVTDIAPVIDALAMNNVVVLKNHGVVAIGEDLFHPFVLVQELEEQVKMDVVSKHYEASNPLIKAQSPNSNQQSVDAYELFSLDQIKAIVALVNEDKQMQELGVKTAMNMTLAVVLDNTQQAHRFTFANGRIVETSQDTQAEFVINAPEDIWRSVFKGQLDPFVATTQKKMVLKGDFARISKWYAPCSRIFQLWTKVGVR